MRHQAFQKEGLILRLQGTLPAVAMVLPMIGNRGDGPFQMPGGFTRPRSMNEALSARVPIVATVDYQSRPAHW